MENIDRIANGDPTNEVTFGPIEFDLTPTQHAKLDEAEKFFSEDNNDLED